MAGILTAASGVVWGVPMLVFYLVSGVMFTVRCRFIQFTGVREWLFGTLGSVFGKNRRREKSLNGISQYGAFCSVLAACIGTGNIVGVATAIASGGPGCVFWMWASALLGMATSYSENFLGIKYRAAGADGRVTGGALAYMERGMGMPGLANGYAVLLVMSSLGTGNMTQANSVSEALYSGFGVPVKLTAIIMSLLCLVAILGGVKRIAKLSEAVVPLMCGAFLVLSFAVIFTCRTELPACVRDIFREAFTLKGLYGFGCYKAMRFGVARGVFSNEAGVGTSTFMHSEAESNNPREQGLWGMFEVFCDTIFLCTVTALAILVTGKNKGTALYGAALSVECYGVIGAIGRKGIALLTAVFAFASLVGWSVYGEKSGEYLLKRKISLPYKLLYSAVAFLGCITSPRLIWSAADVTSGLMALPNLFSVVGLRKQVD